MFSELKLSSRMLSNRLFTVCFSNVYRVGASWNVMCFNAVALMLVLFGMIAVSWGTTLNLPSGTGGTPNETSWGTSGTVGIDAGNAIATTSAVDTAATFAINFQYVLQPPGAYFDISALGAGSFTIDATTSDVINIGGLTFTVNALSGQIVTFGAKLSNSTLITSPHSGGLTVSGGGSVLFDNTNNTKQYNPGMDIGALYIAGSTATLPASSIFGVAQNDGHTSYSSIMLDSTSGAAALILGSGVQVGGNNSCIPVTLIGTNNKIALAGSAATIAPQFGGAGSLSIDMNGGILSLDGNDAAGTVGTGPSSITINDSAGSGVLSVHGSQAASSNLDAQGLDYLNTNFIVNSGKLLLSTSTSNQSVGAISLGENTILSGKGYTGALTMDANSILFPTRGTNVYISSLTLPSTGNAIYRVQYFPPTSKSQLVVNSSVDVSHLTVQIAPINAATLAYNLSDVVIMTATSLTGTPTLDPTGLYLDAAFATPAVAGTDITLTVSDNTLNMSTHNQLYVPYALGFLATGSTSFNYAGTLWSTNYAVVPQTSVGVTPTATFSKAFSTYTLCSPAYFNVSPITSQSAFTIGTISNTLDLNGNTFTVNVGSGQTVTFSAALANSLVNTGGGLTVQGGGSVNITPNFTSANVLNINANGSTLNVYGNNGNTVATILNVSDTIGNGTFNLYGSQSYSDENAGGNDYASTNVTMSSGTLNLYLDTGNQSLGDITMMGGTITGSANTGDVTMSGTSQIAATNIQMGNLTMSGTSMASGLIQMSGDLSLSDTVVIAPPTGSTSIGGNLNILGTPHYVVNFNGINTSLIELSGSVDASNLQIDLLLSAGMYSGTYNMIIMTTGGLTSPTAAPSWNIAGVFLDSGHTTSATGGEIDLSLTSDGSNLTLTLTISQALYIASSGSSDYVVPITPLTWTATTNTFGTPYNTAFTSGTLPVPSGGVGPYTYSVLNASSTVVALSGGIYALTHGNLTISGTSFNYAPTAGYHGADSFAYHVADSSSPAQTLSETFSITVAALGDLAGANLTLTEADAANFSNAITNTGAAATLTIDLTTTDEILSGNITDTPTTNPLSLIKTGVNKLTLSGVGTYTGGTSITAGTLEIDHVNVSTHVIDALGSDGVLTMATGTTVQCGANTAGVSETASQLSLPIYYAGSVTINTSDGSASHALSTRAITCTATSGENQINITGGGVYTPEATYTPSTGGGDVMCLCGFGTTLTITDSAYVPPTVRLGNGAVLKAIVSTLPAISVG